VQAEAQAFWAKGFPDAALSKLEDYGFIQSRPKGEFHANNQVRACCPTLPELV
jgi:glutamate synthase (ferredoxin)